MTQISFFVLSPHIRGDRFLLACHLTESFYQKGRHLYLHTDSDEETRHLDRLLWTFRQGSFVPHGLVTTESAELTPVLIGHNLEPQGVTQDLLLNLAHRAPPFFNHFAEVIEPIDQDPVVREAGRARFRFYRDQGMEIMTHRDITF